MHEFNLMEFLIYNVFEQMWGAGFWTLWICLCRVLTMMSIELPFMAMYWDIDEIIISSSIYSLALVVANKISVWCTSACCIFNLSHQALQCIELSLFEGWLKLWSQALDVNVCVCVWFPFTAGLWMELIHSGLSGLVSGEPLCWCGCCKKEAIPALVSTGINSLGKEEMRFW